jgi:hypothetical protein
MSRKKELQRWDRRPWLSCADGRAPSECISALVCFPKFHYIRGADRRPALHKATDATSGVRPALTRRGGGIEASIPVNPQEGLQWVASTRRPRRHARHPSRR